jgi:hypothetical protein
MSKKLYKVTCRGMQGAALGNKVSHGIAYVIAEDPAEAYAKLRTYLDMKDFGFDQDRELEKIELLAEDAGYPDCGSRLFP